MGLKIHKVREIPKPRAGRPMKRGECPVCTQHYSLSRSGRLNRHFGMTLSGFSTGQPCPGIGELPYVAPGA
ncbi:hypothetical protein OV450_1443 [Actinobacteria bacterium OV450]|nr:hypothetical protein OV450_1443 [Actinobacteria bacterium OV450]